MGTDCPQFRSNPSKSRHRKGPRTPTGRPGGLFGSPSITLACPHFVAIREIEMKRDRPTQPCVAGMFVATFFPPVNAAR